MPQEPRTLGATYRDNPRLFVFAAFGAGLALGLAAMSRRNSDIADADWSDVDQLGAETFAIGPPPHLVGNGQLRPNGQVRPNGHNGYGTMTRAKHELGETWAAIADGLVRAASARAVQLLGDLVPGFREQVEGRYAAITPSAAPSWDRRGPRDGTE